MHDEFLNGIKLAPLASDVLLTTRDHINLLVVPPDAPLVQLKRAERVGRRANREVRYDFGVYSALEARAEGVCALIAVEKENDHAVGLVVLQRRHALKRLVPWGVEEPDIAPDEPEVKRMTITFAWVLNKYRRTGIAHCLLQQASRLFNKSLSDFAWLGPFSDSGASLARAIGPHGVFLAR